VISSELTHGVATLDASQARQAVEAPISRMRSKGAGVEAIQSPARDRPALDQPSIAAASWTLGRAAAISLARCIA
jgi:hypothetical protein